MDSVQGHSGRVLLTTRTSAAVASVVTGYVLVLTIRALLHPPEPESGWPITTSVWLPGWLVTVANVILYAGLCWGGFLCIRGARGGERLFLAIWLAAILLSPLKGIGPEWALAIRSVCTAGLTVALFVAISLASRSRRDTGRFPADPSRSESTKG